MSTFLNLVISGLATGAIYALIAVGFTLLWQASQTINFAQGEFVMAPAFFVLAAMSAGLPFWIAVLVGMVLTVILFGLLFKQLLVGPMLKHGVLPLAIATMALSILVKEAVKDFYSAEALPFPSILPDTNINILGINVSLQSIGVFATAIFVMFGLQWFLNNTLTGRQMQAASQNPDVAEILGVPVSRMIMYTFLANAFLAGIASLLITPIYLAKFSSGEVLGVAAFIAAIVGGFNNTRGAIVGGFLVGVITNLSAAYISSAYRDAVPLFLLIAVILLRPEGIVGTRQGRKV